MCELGVQEGVRVDFRGGGRRVYLSLGLRSVLVLEDGRVGVVHYLSLRG